MIRALQPNPDSPLYDVARKPGAPVKCDGCGKIYDWHWWERREWDQPQIQSRWFAPRVPCRDCEAKAEDDAVVASLAKRQIAAGIPPKFRGHRVDRIQAKGKNEPEPAFRKRVLATDPPVIGQWFGNHTAVKVIQSWKPGLGWLWLQGSQGGGKSLFASVIVTRLLQRSARRSVPLVGEDHPQFDALERANRNFRFVGGGGGKSVLMINEDMLHARAKLSWQGDRAPLGKISKVSILVLDDLGTCGRDKENAVKAVPRAVADTIEKLLAYRYERKLATVITSNEPLDNAGTLYGKRVASRLAEMIPEGGTGMGGADWRRDWLG